MDVNTDTQLQQATAHPGCTASLPEAELRLHIVHAKQDETVAFAWIEWPDKPSRDDGMKRFHELAKTDDRFDEQKYPVPFDGARMIFGGFSVVLDV